MDLNFDGHTIVPQSTQASPAQNPPTQNTQPNSVIPGQTSTPSGSVAGIKLPDAGQTLDDQSFMAMMPQIENYFHANNELNQQKQALVGHLFDTPMTPDQIAKLPPDMQKIVQSGDPNAISLQIRILNDQMQGRNTSLDTAVSALTTGYTSAKENTQNAMTQILNYAKATGQPIDTVTKALSAVYGVNLTSQMMDSLKELGAPLVTTSQLTPDMLLGTSGSSSSTAIPGNAVSNISSSIGVAPTVPLSSVIQSNPDGLVDAIINNEGGSPNGVLNNPGNIKFVGMSGQIDSGVKATDGGTFASYASPEQGRQAISDVIQHAANTDPNATLSSFISAYTNTIDPTVSPNAASATEYGILSKSKDFNPNNNLDQKAVQWLNTYIYQGRNPTAADVGISARSGTIGAMTAIKKRANDLLAEQGVTLPDMNILTANKKIINSNNILLNKLKVQDETVKTNFGLSIENLNDNNINKSLPIINAMADAFEYATGDPDVAAYISQNTTLQNEAASLIAVKNASGTTVYDKMEAAGLIPANASADQQKEILKKLLQEAQNAQDAIQSANTDLYKQVDPLQKDPDNPVNVNKKEIASAGGKDNGDGTYTMPDGTIVTP